MEIDEGQARFVDAMCKIVGVIALIIGGVWTLVVYNGHLKEVEKTSQTEAWKPYLSQRLQLYTGVTNLVGQVNGSDDADKAQKAGQELSILYHGRSRLFVEDNVQRVWTEFEACRSAKDDTHCSKKINTLAAILGEESRDAIAKEWNISLPADSATLHALEESRK